MGTLPIEHRGWCPVIKCGTLRDECESVARSERSVCKPTSEKEPQEQAHAEISCSQYSGESACSIACAPRGGRAVYSVKH